MTTSEEETTNTQSLAADAASGARTILDQADRSMALRQWEKAADQYAEALEELSQEYQEDAPTLAPILHRYGRCLLEHAIATSAALGGGGGGAGAAEAPMPSRKSGAKAESSKAGSSSKSADPRFSFGGDVEDDDDEEDGEDAEGQGEEGGEEGEEEDADDLGVAFSVLDLARVIYSRLVGAEGDVSANGSSSAAVSAPGTLETIEGAMWDSTKIKTELAEVLNDLGDVGLESENFTQASSDYEASLSLLSPMLHPHSRRLADAYLRLGLALEFHPDPSKQSTAQSFVQSASNTLKTRLEALKTREAVFAKGDDDEARRQAAAAEVREEKALEESREAVATTTATPAEDSLLESTSASSSAGKGKSKSSSATEPSTIMEKDDVVEMSPTKVTTEIKDVSEMLTELQLKLEEYNQPSTSLTSSSTAAGGPSSSSSSAATQLPASAKQALQDAINDAFLGASTNASPFLSGSGSAAAAAASGPINDLSGMVKRKKKRDAQPEEGVPAAAATAAEASSTSAQGEVKASKKARVEDE